MCPKEYEEIRDDCIASGKDEAACKTKAAKIYNSKPANKAHPVTRNEHTAKKLKSLGKGY